MENTIKTMVRVVFTSTGAVSRQVAPYAAVGRNGDVLGYAERPGRIVYDRDGRVMARPVATLNFQVEG